MNSAVVVAMPPVVVVAMPPVVVVAMRPVVVVAMRPVVVVILVAVLYPQHPMNSAVVVAMRPVVVAILVAAVLYPQMLYEHPMNYLAFRPYPSALVSTYLHPSLQISLLLFPLAVANLLGPILFCILVLFEFH